MITVIGGAGFIGTNLCHLLNSKKLSFEILDLKESRSFPEQTKICDIREISTLKESIQGNIIINLAAVHRDDVFDKSEYYETNVNGTKNITAIAEEKGIKKIVFTSSVAVYGFVEKKTGEDGAINPFNDYGKTKYLAEKVLNEWFSTDTKGKSLLIVRPTVVFGEGNRGNVYNLLNQIASNKFVMIGNGKNKKSMAYVGNIVEFLYNCIISDQKKGVFNYVDTPDFDMNSLISTIDKNLFKPKKFRLRIPYFLGIFLGYISEIFSFLTRKKLPVSSIRVKKFCASTCFSTSKSSLNNFSPPYSLEEGLRRTIKSEFLEPDPKREVFYTE